jgi:hypothetical protein
MPVTTNHKKTSATKKGAAKVDEKVGNYEKHPFFVQKATEAKAILKEAGLPEKSIKSKTK